MIKNIVIAILIIIVVAEGYFFWKQHTASTQVAMSQSSSQNLPPAGPNAKRRGAPIIMSKGMNLKTSPLFKFAYEIAPSITPNAQKALVGWKITSASQSGGATTVTLTPSDSEDQSQQYIVKSSEILYFIEQTPVDDKSDQDKDYNYRDDYGIITDSQGVIQ